MLGNARQWLSLEPHPPTRDWSCHGRSPLLSVDRDLPVCFAHPDGAIGLTHSEFNYTEYRHTQLCQWWSINKLVTPNVLFVSGLLHMVLVSIGREGLQRTCRSTQTMSTETGVVTDHDRHLPRGTRRASA
jgi:hypothetical protein